MQFQCLLVSFQQKCLVHIRNAINHLGTICVSYNFRFTCLLTFLILKPGPGTRVIAIRRLYPVPKTGSAAHHQCESPSSSDCKCIQNAESGVVWSTYAWVTHDHYSVARQCLHCCKGELFLWRMANWGYQNSEIHEPIVTKFGTCDYVGGIIPHAKIQSDRPSGGIRSRQMVKYYSRVVFSYFQFFYNLAQFFAGVRDETVESIWTLFDSQDVNTRLLHSQKDKTAKCFRFPNFYPKTPLNGREQAFRQQYCSCHELEMDANYNIVVVSAKEAFCLQSCCSIFILTLRLVP